MIVIQTTDKMFGLRLVGNGSVEIYKRNQEDEWWDEDKLTLAENTPFVDAIQQMLSWAYQSRL